MQLRPNRTLRYKALDASALRTSETVLSAGNAQENRAQIPLWSDLAGSDPARVRWIHARNREFVDVETSPGNVVEINLHDDSALDLVVEGDEILLDISGLAHHIWAPIVRRLRANRIPTRVVYVEPESYTVHSSPASNSLFDLTVTFEGLAPLPGFARLGGPFDENQCLFVATLGFEGSRPESLALQIDPAPRVIPVIGVPGFQLEFPSYTIACNRNFLEVCKAHQEIRLARASCPFEVLSVLREIHRDYPDFYMYLAPVGTKPHALGAVLYALENPDLTEIMFDHPVRKKDRTSGAGTIHIYDLGRYDGL